MCMLDEKYRKYVCNHPQVMFDEHEWDYNAYPKTVKNYYNYGREHFQYKSDNQDKGKCGICPGKNVCGGCNNIYEVVYGTDEFTPETMPMSDYPFYYRSEEKECDIVVLAYKIGHNLNKLLLEIMHKTRGPYNLIVVHKHQDAWKNRNYGLDRTRSPFIIMMDDDIAELPYAWNIKMIDKLLYGPKVCGVSARLMNVDGTVGLNSANNFSLKDKEVEVNMIPTTCCAFRRNDIDRTFTKFDKRFVASYYEDTAFFYQLSERCREAGLGDKFVINNECRVVHFNNETGANVWKDYNRQVYEEIVEEEVEMGKMFMNEKLTKENDNIVEIEEDEEENDEKEKKK